MRRMGMSAAAAFGAAATVCAAPASAVEEIHVGVMAHNVQITDGKNAGKESGPNLEAEITFASPALLRLIGAPRPYVMGSLNVAGDTSFAGAGLSWRWRLAPNWSLEPGLGYVVHTGELENAFPDGDPRAEQFNADNVLLGSRDLFRTSLGLSRRIGPTLTAQLFFEHLSHGQILGEGRNQGLDELGVRIGWRPGGG